MTLASITKYRIEFARFTVQAVAKGHTLPEVRGALAAALVVFRGYTREESHAIVRAAI